MSPLEAILPPLVSAPNAAADEEYRTVDCIDSKGFQRLARDSGNLRDARDRICLQNGCKIAALCRRRSGAVLCDEAFHRCFRCFHELPLALVQSLMAAEFDHSQPPPEFAYRCFRMHLEAACSPVSRDTT